MKNKKLLVKKIFLFSVFCFLSFVVLTGCATVPKSTLPAYSLNGVTYYALIPLCESRGIDWEYDTFARIIRLNKGEHRINLRVGDDLVLVDQRAILLNRPVDMHAGTPVVPAKFREIIDGLFKDEKTVPRQAAAFPLSRRIHRVVVDAGHGGNDPGAIGRTGLKEKEVNLDIAKRLAKLLKAEGVEAVMTRSTDKFIPLGTRVQIANNAKADLFISIHSNANHTRSMHGFEAYCVSSSVNNARRAFSVARSAGFDLKGTSLASHSLELKAMLWDMLLAYDRAESIELARLICKSIGRNMDARVIGVKDARFEVLRGARMPAVLVESGFLSNREEERKLKNGLYRQKIAESIMGGVSDYARELVLAED